MDRIIEKEELTEYLDATKPMVDSCPLGCPRCKFYHYMIQEGILEDLLLEGTGINPTEFSVAPAIKDGKAPHPDVPTFVVHGTIDDKVPIVQADDVVEAMKAKSLSVGTYVRLRQRTLLIFKQNTRRSKGRIIFSTETEARTWVRCMRSSRRLSGCRFRLLLDCIRGRSPRVISFLAYAAWQMARLERAGLRIDVHFLRA